MFNGLGTLLGKGTAATVLDDLGGIISGSGNLSVSANALLDLDVGIDVDPTSATFGQPFLYDSTAIDASAYVSATNLTLGLSIGPIGIFVRHGAAVLDSDGALVPASAGSLNLVPDTMSPATITVGLTGPQATVDIADDPDGATESGSTVTITTATDHGFAVGDKVTIAGVGEDGYNGTFTILSVPTPTSFTYTATESGLEPSGGGTAVGPSHRVYFSDPDLFSDFTFAMNGGANIELPMYFPLQSVPLGGSIVAQSADIEDSPDGATESGSTVTITTTAEHGFAAGDSVTIAGVGVAGYNGTFTILSVTPTTFTYTATRTGLPDSGGGTAVASSPLLDNGLPGLGVSIPSLGNFLTALAQPDQTAPAGVITVTTPDVTQIGNEFSTLGALLDSPALLASGVASVLGGLQGKLTALANNNLPLIGNGLSSDLNVISAFSGTLQTELKAIAGVNPLDVLQQIIYGVLGPGNMTIPLGGALPPITLGPGANLLVDENGNPPPASPPNLEDIIDNFVTLTEDSDSVEFDIHLAPPAPDIQRCARGQPGSAEPGPDAQQRHHAQCRFQLECPVRHRHKHGQR